MLECGVRLDDVTTGERVIVIAGTLLFFDSFLPWFRTCFSFFGSTTCPDHGAWSNVFSALAVLIAMVMVAQVVVRHVSTHEMRRPGNLTWGQAHVYAGALTLALVILQLLVGDDPLGRSYGLFAGLVLAGALAYGGYLRSQEPEPAAGDTPS